MLLGAIQMSGEELSNVEVMDISRSLETDSVRLLSLRECNMADREFRNISRGVCKCKSILQLNLNLGVVSSFKRAEILSGALLGNRSLTSLFLHGSRLGNEGAEVLCRSLSQHPHIISLDLGDCLLGDAAIRAVCELLPPNGAKPGLHELTVSANPAITSKGWTQFCIALSVCNVLRKLSLDYNNLGDYVAGCLAVALPHCRELEMLDLEGTGITEHAAKLILHLLRNYPVSLRYLILNENKIRFSTMQAIANCLEEDSDAETIDGHHYERIIPKHRRDDTDNIMEKVEKLSFSGGMLSSENSTMTIPNDGSTSSIITESEYASTLCSIQQTADDRPLPEMNNVQRSQVTMPRYTVETSRVEKAYPDVSGREDMILETEPNGNSTSGDTRCLNKELINTGPDLIKNTTDYNHVSEIPIASLKSSDLVSQGEGM